MAYVLAKQGIEKDLWFYSCVLSFLLPFSFKETTVFVEAFIREFSCCWEIIYIFFFIDTVYISYTK